MKQHVARIIVATCFLLFWMEGCDYFFDSRPEGFEPALHTVLWERAWAALYTPAVWLDRVLEACLDRPGGVINRWRLFVLCFAQVLPLLMLVVGGWPRAAVWRECLVAYAMIWVCLVVAGYIQLRGGITVFDS